MTEQAVPQPERLLLKWGTLKAWSLGGNAAAMAAFKRYCDDPTSAGAMTQHDTPAQKQAICDIIDAVSCHIQNDWSGEIMSKDEAKKYVLEYGR